MPIVIKPPHTAHKKVRVIVAIKISEGRGAVGVDIDKGKGAHCCIIFR